MSDKVTRMTLSRKSKKWINDLELPLTLTTDTTINITQSRQNSDVCRSQAFDYGRMRRKGYGEFANILY